MSICTMTEAVAARYLHAPIQFVLVKLIHHFAP
jgi:hypothetical protein